MVGREDSAVSRVLHRLARLIVDLLVATRPTRSCRRRDPRVACVGCQNLDRLIHQRQFKQARVTLRDAVKRDTRLIGVAAGAVARDDEDFDGVDVTARALRVAC